MNQPAPVQRMVVPENEDTRLYFSRTELTEKICSPVTRGEEQDHDKFIAPVVEYALQVPGVHLAAASPYSLMVVKVPTYSWDEVEPSIMNLLMSLNSGEGKLFQEEGVTEPVIPAAEDLGNGYTLTFQRKPSSNDVRAVVKTTDGNIIARGCVVSPAAASVSRLQAIDELSRIAPPSCTQIGRE